jgi:uncharacterized protein
MPEEKMSREEAGRMGGEAKKDRSMGSDMKEKMMEGKDRMMEGARKGGEAARHFGEETKEKMMEGKDRMMEGARKSGEHSHSGKDNMDRVMGSSSGKMSKAEAGRMGGEASAGSEKHYTAESKQRQIEGARKGGEHSHGSGRSSSSGGGSKMSREEAGRKGAEARWGNE